MGSWSFLSLISKITRQWRGLLGASLLILLLRLVGAGVCGMSHDELYTIKLASCRLGQMQEFVASDVHPGLYYYVVHFLMILGDYMSALRYSVVWLRLASILPNLALAWLLYFWASRRWGARAGLAALLMVGFSSGMIYYSIELRNYSMAMFFILFSTLAMVKLIAAPSAKWAIVYTVSTILYLNLHYLTGLIYVGQALFLAGYLFLRSRRSEVGAWRMQVLPHFVIGLLLLAQLPVMYGKFSNYYAPYHAFFYTPRLADLLSVLTYDYPAGAVYDHTVSTWYGWLVQAIAIPSYLALGLVIRQGSRDAQVSAESVLVERICAWQMIFFLCVTWLASTLDLAKLFFGWRSALLTLPLWFLLLVTVIETRLRPRPRGIFRWAFVVLLLPGALYGIYRRSLLLNEFKGISGYARQNSLVMNNAPWAAFYLDDPSFLPWVRSICPQLRFDSMRALVNASIPPGKTLRLFTLRVSDLRLRSPREERFTSLVRRWGREHHFVFLEDSSIELIEVPPSEVAGFIRMLKQVEGSL